ncbi:glycerate kinase [Cronobacter sakazakii]
MFGPQKGATPAMVTELDAALRRFGDQLCHPGPLTNSVAQVPNAKSGSRL